MREQPALRTRWPDRGVAGRRGVKRRQAMREQRTGVAIGIGITLLLMGLYALGVFEWLELRSYDLRYALLPSHPLDTPIRLVRIDEESETSLGVRAPDVPRAMYADAVKQLVRAGAALIAFDIIFSNPRDPVEDEEFGQAITEAGNVVLARYIGVKGHKTPVAVLRQGELGEALINIELDRDGILRSIPLVGLDYSGESADPEPVLAMSLEVARLYLDPEGDHELDLEQRGEVGLGSLRIPYPDGRMRINFYGPPATFPRIPFWRVVKDELAPGEIRGRIVLIGSTAPSLHDSYQTPHTEKLVVALTGQAERMRGVRMDGFEIHANAIQTILDGSFVHRSKDQWGLVPALLAALGLAGGLLLIWSGTRPVLVAVIRVGLYLGIGAVAFTLFWWSRYWLDIVPLYSMLVAQHLGGVSCQRYLEGHKRRQVQSMFGRYVSARVVEQLVQNPDLANPSGRKERLTMFFSDVRGVTSMSEKMEPQDVQHLLSEHFTEMTQIPFQHEGTLDKFMGDAIMAFFGNPEPQPDHARRAVLMALEMQEAVARLNQKWTAAGRRTIGVGMGINTGEVTVGNLGSKDFLDYTVIGDAVNLACRLEEGAKAGEILITQATYDDVKDAEEVEPLEPIRVKARSNPNPICSVLRRHTTGAGAQAPS